MVDCIAISLPLAYSTIFSRLPVRRSNTCIFAMWGRKKQARFRPRIPDLRSPIPLQPPPCKWTYLHHLMPFLTRKGKLTWKERTDEDNKNRKDLFGWRELTDQYRPIRVTPTSYSVTWCLPPSSGLKTNLSKSLILYSPGEHYIHQVHSLPMQSL